MWADRQRLTGLALISVTLVATIWLAATGQLTLYIHPRYVPFTVVMASIGLVLVIASFAVRSTGDDHAHAEGHDAHVVESPADPVTLRRSSRQRRSVRPPSGVLRRPQWRRSVGRAASAVGAALALGAGASLVILPPATLSAATAAQRDVGGGVAATTQSLDDAASAPDDAFATFTVQDWSSLLQQTSDLSFYSGKPADVAGFVIPGPEPSDDVFWVSRFVITHCAIDAQPFAVPVHLEDWQSTLDADQWVRVTGEFASNPSRESTEAIALEPRDLERIDQPAEPYLY